MSFFGGYSKRGRQLEEQDRKFLEFQKQIKEEEIVFEKGDYLATVSYTHLDVYKRQIWHCRLLCV